MHRRYASLPETFWLAFADVAHFPAHELLHQLPWHAVSLKDVLNVSKPSAPPATCGDGKGRAPKLGRSYVATICCVKNDAPLLPVIFARSTEAKSKSNLIAFPDM